MNNIIIKMFIRFIGLLFCFSVHYAQAAVVNFSQCGANSSFALITQNEGPTNTCNGVDTGVGNPINVLNGNKHEAVTDFAELPAFRGLSFSRYYNSQSHAKTAIGFGWYTSFDIKLYDQPEVIQIRLESGERINFKKNKIYLDKNQFVIRAIPLNPAHGWIEKKIDGTGWIWHKTQSHQRYYFQNLGGPDPHLAYITKITPSNIHTNISELRLHFIYDPQQRLTIVKNNQGQQLVFHYTLTPYGLNQITLNTPMGKYFYYLDRNHNLTQVVYPDGRRFKYSYDPKFQGGDIHNITAKWVFDPKLKQFKLISEWQYDRQDRAILSQRANGVERVSIQFDSRSYKNMPANYASNTPIFQNIVTNSLGHKTAYDYQIKGTQYRLLESFGSGCASCGEVNKRFRFNSQGLVTYAADLNPSKQVIRAFEVKYNELGEVISRTVSGQGIQSQTTHYEYESFQHLNGDPAETQSNIPIQFDHQDNRRLKAESRDSVVFGKKYRKEYLYNSHNQLIMVKETGFSPLGKALLRETKYGYDQHGRLSWEDGPQPNGPTNRSNDSDITTYTYGKNDLLESWVTAYNRSKTLAHYDHLGRVTQYIKTSNEIDNSTNKQIFNFHYDSNHRYKEINLQTANHKILQGVRYQYDHLGRLETITDLNHQLIKTYNYDDINRVSASVDRENGLRSFSYDSESNIIQKQNLTTNRITNTGYKYDNNGRLTTIADSKLGVLSQVDYFNDGLSGRVIDHHGDELWLKYSANGQLETQWRVPSQPENLIPPDKTEYYYANGIYRVTQNDGTTTTKYADDFGRLAIVDSSIQGRIIYHLDAYDRYDKIVYATGATLKFTYDDLGRVATKLLTQPEQDGLEKVELLTTYTYSGNKLVEIRDPEQILSFRYNEQGKLDTQRILYTGLKTPITTYYHYDKNGNALSSHLPDGTHITTDGTALYAKGVGDLFKTAFLRQEKTDKQLTYVMGNKVRMGFEYSPTGIWRGLHYTTGTAQQSFSLIRSAYAAHPSQVLLSQHWQYDNKRRISDVQTTGLQTIQQGYLYDGRDHVIATIYPGQNEQLQERYFYDALGNRLMGQAHQDSIVGYHYQNSQLISIQQNSQQDTVTYNRMGQPILYPTQHGILKFSYINGQISRVWRDGQLIAAYSYNDAGQRIKKVLYTNTNGEPLKKPTVQYYFYDGIKLAGELNAHGDITRQYLYTGNRLLATIDYPQGMKPYSNKSKFKKIYAVINKIKGKQPQGQWHYILNDYMGRPRLVTNMKQQVVWHNDSQALFGSHQLSTTISQTHYVLNLRFIGQYADQETGLYYNGYRYYDPITGRYTTPDPLGLSGGENQYAYVNQQPNQYFDPQGLLLFAFDGTGNTDTNNTPSNVEKFMDAYASKGQIDVTSILWKNQEKQFTSNAEKGLTANHDNVFYISGAGTEDQYTEIGSSITNISDSATGESLPNRVDQMLVYFSEYVHKLIDLQQAKGNQAKAEVIDIDIVGFSRGAASARLFASKLENLMNGTINPDSSAALLKPRYQSIGVGNLRWDKDLKCKMDAAKISLSYRFLGLWDTVPALGLNPNDDMTQYNSLGMSLTVTDRFKSVAHAVAVNDHREAFMVRSIYKDSSSAKKLDDLYKSSNNTSSNVNTRIERGFMGAHSDIGGGYSEGDLSNVALMWMIDQAKKVGIQFSDQLIHKRKYNVITDPIVHDSTGNSITGDGVSSLAGPYFDPGRDFAWANSNNGTNRINQHLTGMNIHELSQYLKGYREPQMEAQPGSQVNHLVLDWKDTLEFQNEQYNASNPGKFQRLLDLEKQFTTDNDCKSGEIIGGCQALTEYQKFKIRR